MIELKITDGEECFCKIEGNVLDVSAQATVAIERMLEPIPKPLQSAILMVAAMNLRNSITE